MYLTEIFILFLSSLCPSLTFFSFILGEIIMFDGHVVVYKNSIDVFIYIVGSADENELILANILSAYYDALSILLK